MSSRYVESLRGQIALRTDIFPHEDSTKIGLKLNEPQREATQNLVAALRSETRSRFPIILPCGTGKTEIGLNIIGASQAAKKALRMRGERKDLLISTEISGLGGIYDRANDDFGFDVGKWFGGQRDLDHPIVVASVQAIHAAIARRQIQDLIPRGTIDLAVFDEADLYLTPKRRAMRSTLSPKISIALTATPDWPDGRSIEEEYEFGKAIKKMGLREGIESGVNAMPYIYYYQSEIPENQLRVRTGEYDQKYLEAAWRLAELHLAMPKIYSEIVPEEDRQNCPTLVFVPSVKMVQATVQTMEKQFGKDISIVGLSGKEVSSDDLAAYRDLFRDGEIQILVTCERGGRSMNVENAALILDFYPTLSLNKLTQRHGRGLRKIQPGSRMWEQGRRKDEAVIVQCIPKTYARRPALFTDILCGYQEYLRLRERKGRGGSGPPTQDVVDRIRRRIEEKNPNHFLRRVFEINALEAIKRIDELPQADESGFLRIPPRYVRSH
jgi:superfamily II DNA or RNA helicase